MLLSPTAPTPRKPITAEVIQVAERATTLDPVTETAEVQRMINAHNAALPPRGVGSSDRMEIKRTVFYTAYLVAPNDTAKLTTLIHLPSNMSGNDVKFLANNIMITARPCPPTILNRIGGNGHMQTWKITGTAVYESRVWVARVAPVPANSAVHTDHQVPMVVLGHLKNTRSFEALRIQNWQPVRPEEEFVFQTVVGERVQLRIEREIEGESEYEALFAHPNPKRRQPDEPRYEADNYRPSQSQSQRGNYSNDENRRSGQGNISGNYRSGNLSRGRGGGSGPGVRHPQHASGRGGRGGVGGGGGGGGGRGGGGNRGRGRGGYKSLDDVGNGGGRYGGQGSMYQNSQQPNYDDGPSYSAGNGDTFNASYPPLGGGSGRDNNNNGAGEGLPHGK